MSTNSLLKDFFKYSSLNVLGMIGLSCYILADTYFVAKGMGSDGLTALNLAIPAFGFIQGSGLMLGIGGATRYSIVKSQGAGNDGNKTFMHSLIQGALFAGVFIIIAIFFIEPLTVLLGANGSTFEMCKIYLRVLLLFSPAFLLNNIMLSFVRNDGAPQLSMAAMLTGSLTNIIFDYVFIFPLNMGIFGAALATGTSPIVSLAVLSAFFIRRKNNFKPIKCRFSVRTSAKIMSLGASSFVTEVSSGVVMFTFNMIMLNIAGNIGVAAYGVIANISLVVISVYTGLAQGIQPLISKNHGSGNKAACRRILKYSLFSAGAISVIVYAFIFLYCGPVTSIFNGDNNEALQNIAVQGMKLYFTGSVFAGSNILLAAYFAANDRARPSGLISVLRGFVLIILFAILLSRAWGLVGLWLSFPTSELAVFIISAFLLERAD